jgi:hypothetical protein
MYDYTSLRAGRQAAGSLNGAPQQAETFGGGAEGGEVVYTAQGNDSGRRARCRGVRRYDRDWRRAIGQAQEGAGR